MLIALANRCGRLKKHRNSKAFPHVSAAYSLQAGSSLKPLYFTVRLFSLKTIYLSEELGDSNYEIIILMESKKVSEPSLGRFLYSRRNICSLSPPWLLFPNARGVSVSVLTGACRDFFLFFSAYRWLLKVPLWFGRFLQDLSADSSLFSLVS